MLEARDVEEIGRVEFEVFEDGIVFVARAGLEAFMIQAVVNDVDFIFGNSKETGYVMRGRAAHCDQRVLAASETFYDVAAVKHACDVVFAADVKGREVVDSADFRTGRTKQQSAVAGN